MKMSVTRRKGLILLTLGLAASMTSCREVEDEYHHYQLHFENHSEKVVRVALEVENRLEGRSRSSSLYYRYENIIESNQTQSLAYEGMNRFIWEYFIAVDTLVIHVLDNEFKPLDKHIAHRVAEYRLTNLDLSALNWHVAYPPTEQMKKYNVTEEDKYFSLETYSWE